jgi:hypothetical protein
MPCPASEQMARHKLWLPIGRNEHRLGDCFTTATFTAEHQASTIWQ